MTIEVGFIDSGHQQYREARDCAGVAFERCEPVRQFVSWPHKRNYSGYGNGYYQNPFLFAGGTQDPATGWVHYGARWYNPTTGRWTQQDTLDNPLNPKNANRYAYAGNDPTNNIDPTGRSCILQTLGAVAAIGSIGLAAGLTVGSAGFLAISIGLTTAVAVAAVDNAGVACDAARRGD